MNTLNILTTMPIKSHEPLREDGLPLLARARSEKGAFEYYVNTISAPHKKINQDGVSYHQDGTDLLFGTHDGITNSTNFPGETATRSVQTTIAASIPRGLSPGQILNVAHKELCQRLAMVDGESGAPSFLLRLSQDGKYAWASIGDPIGVHIYPPNWYRHSPSYRIVNPVDRDKNGKLIAYLGMDENQKKYKFKLHSGGGQLKLGEILILTTDGIAHEHFDWARAARHAIQLMQMENHVDSIADYLFKESSLSAKYADDKSVVIIHHRKELK